VRITASSAHLAQFISDHVVPPPPPSRVAAFVARHVTPPVSHSRSHIHLRHVPTTSTTFPPPLSYHPCRRLNSQPSSNRTIACAFVPPYRITFLSRHSKLHCHLLPAATFISLALAFRLHFHLAATSILGHLRLATTCISSPTVTFVSFATFVLPQLLSLSPHVAPSSTLSCH
jgi:hypothetical protein